MYWGIKYDTAHHLEESFQKKINKQSKQKWQARDATIEDAKYAKYLIACKKKKTFRSLS